MSMAVEPLSILSNPGEPMITKFLVKIGRGGLGRSQYVQRVRPASVDITSDRKLALIMGKLTAEDAIKTIQNTRCKPELVAIRVQE